MFHNGGGNRRIQSTILQRIINRLKILFIYTKCLPRLPPESSHFKVIKCLLPFAERSIDVHVRTYIRQTATNSMVHGSWAITPLESFHITNFLPSKPIHRSFGIFLRHNKLKVFSAIALHPPLLGHRKGSELSLTCGVFFFFFWQTKPTFSIVEVAYGSFFSKLYFNKGANILLCVRCAHGKIQSPGYI